MPRVLYRALLLALFIAIPATTLAQSQATPEPDEQVKPPDNPPGVSLTIYSTEGPLAFNPQQFIAQQRSGYDPYYARSVPGFGVVKETRWLEFEQGKQVLSFNDVAAFINPTTVIFTDLTDPEGTTILEQRFLFNLFDPAKLLRQYLGQTITVNHITGKLLSVQGRRVILRTDSGIRFTEVKNIGQLNEDLLDALIIQPTLQWLLIAEQGGRHKVRTTYQTGGLTWRADYHLVLNQEATQASLGAWVTLLNVSGKTYHNARLQLIAGEVRRIEPEDARRYRLQVARAGFGGGGAAGFKEQAFYTYHLYTLPRRTTLRQNAVKQLTLFPTAYGVNVDKVLVYYGQAIPDGWTYAGGVYTERTLGLETNTEVDVYIRFHNTEENNLGIPLPRGLVRVYKRDPTDGTIEFVGEDLIDHTPEGETLLIKTGTSFDVVGERKRTDFYIDTTANVIKESFRIEIRNHKEEDVKVLIKEVLYRWVNWEIIEASHDYKKINYRTIRFPVHVPAGGKTVVTYTVRYTW